MLVDYLLKKKERIQKFKEARDSRYTYKNELDKAWVQHDLAYGDFKDLAKRTASGKVFRDTAKNPKYGGYQRGLAFMAYKYFDKKTHR